MPKFPKVKMYSTEWCVYCKYAKKFFEENKVPFEEVDVENNPKEAEEMVEKSGQMGVPVIDIGGKIIVGFDREGIKKALGMK